MINISEIVAKTEAMFDLLNEHFYQNELIRPAITVSSDNGRGAYGWCSIYEIWQGANEAHREIGRRYLREWIDTYGVIEGAPQLLEDVRKAGLRTYLLSDFPPCFSVLWDKYEFLHHFDGRVVSCEVGYSKKDGVICDILLEKYGLDGAECLFIDDVPKNVEIGEAHGIPGVVFTDMPSLRRELVSLGVLPR